MSSWLPWMELGARPGGLTFCYRGRKLDAYAEVPERTRAYIADHHPETSLLFAGLRRVPDG